jgi:hypothetical protein
MCSFHALLLLRRHSQRDVGRRADGHAIGAKFGPAAGEVDCSKELERTGVVSGIAEWKLTSSFDLNCANRCVRVSSCHTKWLIHKGFRLVFQVHK